MMYRHGDLLIIMAAVPADARKQRRRNGRLVLAEGEVTGHAHAILDPGADLYDLIPAGDVDEMRQRFLRVTAEVALTHEEHATIMLPPGEYEVRRQREYTPERVRWVAD